MEAIWKYTREAVAPLPVALTGVEKCDTAHLPIGKHAITASCVYEMLADPYIFLFRNTFDPVQI